MKPHTKSAEWWSRAERVIPLGQSYERQAVRFLAWLRDEADPPVDGATGAASVRPAHAIRTAGHCE